MKERPMFDALDFTQKPTILIVDDASDNLVLMAELLKDAYKVKLANNGEKALQIAQGASPPDLIILDIMMPGLSGFEVCEMLKANAFTRNIPIIFLTSMSATKDEQRGLELGAVDFITKPVNPPIVLARVATQIQAKAHAEFLKDQSSYLEAEVERRTRDLAALQDVTIMAMASLAETRDNETGNHILRTQHYVALLARKLQTYPRFTGFLTDAVIDMLFKSAPLHDIGKVGIPDRILLKPGRLDAQEFELMKTHCQLGRDAIQQAEKRLGRQVEFLKYAKEIAYGHQEKWDGSGYPQGQAGEAIPVSARLMAVADVYDALISRRVYKEPMSHDQAMEIIVAGRGKHFDPDMVDALLALAGEFEAVAQRFADTDSDIQQLAASQRIATGADSPVP